MHPVAHSRLGGMHPNEGELALCEQEEKVQPSNKPPGCSTRGDYQTFWNQFVDDLEVMSSGEDRELFGIPNPNKRKRCNPPTSTDDCMVRSDYCFDVRARACGNIPC